jgi:hypothetical protein
VSRRTFAGLAVVVENPAGTTRRWYDADGRESGSTEMRHDYGYIDGHLGVDGEEIDCYLGPDESAANVYAVDQMKAPGYQRLDEQKFMLGFPDEAAAKAAYLAHRNDGERAFGALHTIRLEDFKATLSRRTGQGKIMAQVLFSIPSFCFAVGSLDEAIGKWSRGATFGRKVQNGVEIDFTPETLGQMVDNVAARGMKLSICQDHLSAVVLKTGRPAPSLGYFYGLSVFVGGKLVKHWSLDGEAAPDGVDEAGQPRDGLYCRLGEITPLGRDPKEGLANYSSLSPMFKMKWKNELGQDIGAMLFDFAATSMPFQAGTAIQFHAGGGGDADLPPGEEAITMATSGPPVPGAKCTSPVLPGKELEVVRVEGDNIVVRERYTGQETSIPRHRVWVTDGAQFSGTPMAMAVGSRWMATGPTRSTR